MARHSHWEKINRVETLVDGIFAIAMTLLVLNITIPQLTSPISNLDLQNILFGLVPKLFVYALSFILLAIFWRINHSQFYYIKRFSQTLMWITVIWLLFVALVPFSTSLVGEYGDLTSAELFFTINIFLIGSLSAATWYYVTEKNLVKNDLSLEEIKTIRKMNMVLPLVSLLAAGVSFFIPSWSGITFVLIPILLRIIGGKQ